MDYTPGQRLALLLAAQVDARLTSLERARAASTAELIEARREPVAGMLVGQVLTEAGLEWVRAALPPPSSAHFPRVVADLVRRARGAGFPCSDVRVEPANLAGRLGWRVCWEGDGWLALSRQSDSSDAASRRSELEDTAHALGLVIEPEAAPTLLAVAPATVPESIDITLEQMNSARYMKIDGAVVDLSDPTPMDRALLRLEQEDLVCSRATLAAGDRDRLRRITTALGRSEAEALRAAQME